MSRPDTTTDEAEVRRLIRDSFKPWEKSRQAVYHGSDEDAAFSDINRHDDGGKMYQWFTDSDGKSLPPFHKVLEREQRAVDRGEGSQLFEYPETYLNSILHLNDAEKAALERNDLGIFEDTSFSRRKVMESLAHHPEYFSVIEDGGKDIHGHAKPGRGKSSFLNWVSVVRNAEINNDTILWMLTLDELECLPVAPWMTILKPASVDTRVLAKPTRYDLPTVEINLTDVFRDVVEYASPRDVFDIVVPGGIYGVLPDPRFRQCRELVRATYTSAWEADDPTEITPLRDWIHAVLEVRARQDAYLHPTTMIVDEFGDLVPENPEDNASDEKTKVEEWPKRYGKGRKKNLSLYAMSHSLSEPDYRVLEKERWFATFPRTPVPSSTRSGLGDVPLPHYKPKTINLGSAFVWDSVNYVEVSWPNPYRRYEWHGEIDIRYPEMEAATGAHTRAKRDTSTRGGR